LITIRRPSALPLVGAALDCAHLGAGDGGAGHVRNLAGDRGPKILSVNW
jgi:hypothetical protein